MPTTPQDPNSEFINQLERLYRGGDQSVSNPSKPAPQPAPFRTTNVEKAINSLNNVIQDEDASRQAATERNNAIQDNAARQTQAQLDADLLRQQEQAALERIKQNRLSRPPNELLERQFPDRPGLTNVERWRDQRPSGQLPGGASGSGGGRSGSGGGGRPGSGGGSPVVEPPGGIPSGGLPEPSLSPIEAPVSIPAGAGPALSNLGPVARVLGPVNRVLGPVGLVLSLVGGIQQIGSSLAKEENAIQRLLDPPPQLFPGFGQAANHVQPVTPTPYNANDNAQYRVTTVCTFGRFTLTGMDTGQPAGDDITEFTVQGPILGTVIEYAVSADGIRYGASLVVLSGDANQPHRDSPGGGGTFLGGGITRIVRLDRDLQVYSSPDPANPTANPRRSFPAAPQPQQQPIAPAPTLNPAVPLGTTPGNRSNPSPPTAPNPIAPAFPSPSPGVPSIPGIGGIPLIPLGIPQRTAVPSAVPGAMPSPGAGASSGGGAPDANPYYQPKWADPTTDPQPGDSGTPATPPPTNPTALLCRFQFDQQVRSGVSQANTGITQTKAEVGLVEKAQVALQGFMEVQMTEVNNKLGPLIPGGITGQLLLQWGRMVKMWNFLQIDRLLNVLTWIGVLHNAYQLSSGLTQTLFSAIANSLDAIGIQKVDEHGNESPYDIGDIVSHWTDGFFKKLFGVQTVDGIKEQWKKYNRIYQAATNLLNSIQSMMYTVLDAMQNIGEYVSKIGNAAKTFGTFAENCYDWMTPKFDFMNSKFFKGLDSVNTFLQNIDQISSNVVDGQQQFQELNNQKTELDKSIADGVGAKQKEEDRKKQQSAGAPVTTTAERKPES